MKPLRGREFKASREDSSHSAVQAAPSTAVELVGLISARGRGRAASGPIAPRRLAPRDVTMDIRTAAPILLVLAISACGGGGPEPLGPTGKVEASRIERRVVATGTIEPEKEIEVRPRVSGIVERIHVAAGDHVRAGQPLVEIEKELTEVRHAEARALLEEASAELRFAESAMRRGGRLHRDGTMDDQQHDELTSRFERARAAVARASANVDLLAVELRYATVEAPIDGKILDVEVEEGSAVASVQTVTGGTPLLWIAKAEDLHLEGLVDENEIAHVAVGQAARIRTEAFGEREFAGHVRDIKPLGQRQQNVTYFEVEISVDGEDAQLLRPRMSGDADIIAEVVEDAVVIPETALHYEGEGAFVQRIVTREPPEIERVPIEIGIVEEDRVQVRSGLAVGDEIVLR
jgi:HlyD family secretion protein